MPSTVHVKKDGAYELEVAAGLNIKSGGQYVAATILDMKISGVYHSNPDEAPVNIVPPSISGVAAVGSVLTCTPGVWTGKPSPAKTYEWMVGNSPIAGAEGLTYTVQAGAAGNPIKIREIATNSEGIHSVFSNVIAIP